MSLMHSLLFLRRLFFTAVLLAIPASGTGEPAPQPRSGWDLELLASAPEVRHPSVVCAAPDGRIFVAEDPMDISSPNAQVREGVSFASTRIALARSSPTSSTLSLGCSIWRASCTCCTTRGSKFSPTTKVWAAIQSRSSSKHCRSRGPVIGTITFRRISASRWMDSFTSQSATKGCTAQSVQMADAPTSMEAA